VGIRTQGTRNAAHSQSERLYWLDTDFQMRHGGVAGIWIPPELKRSRARDAIAPPGGQERGNLPFSTYYLLFAIGD
jgi:hypothetical protein